MEYGKVIVYLQEHRGSKPWNTEEELAWWANFLLTLSEKNEYDLLTNFLTTAQAEGYLGELRQAAEQIVRERNTPKPGVKKAKARILRAVA